MKEELLKSVAQPMQVFYAPFKLFIFNFMFTVILAVFCLFFRLGIYLPMVFVLFLVNHLILIVIGKREPHIDNIIASRKNIRARTKNLLRENGNKFTA